MLTAHTCSLGSSGLSLLDLRLICRELAVNSILEILESVPTRAPSLINSLSDNAIGDKGAVMISGAVELNRCLVTLE